MSKFLYRLILFILPISAFFACLEFGIRQIPNDYSYKNSWLDKNVSSVQILIAGTSQGLYGFNPQYFSKRTFNGCHVSQTPKYDKFLIDKFIDKADSLQYIILPVAYHTLCYDLEDGQEWWRVKSYCIYYNCPFHRFEPKYQTELYGLNIWPQIKRLGRFIIKDVDAINCDSLGFGTNYSKENRAKTEWYNNGEARIKGHTKDINKLAGRIKENKDRINSIASSCKRNNVQLILVTMPVHKSYSERIDSAQYNLTISFCDSLVNSYNNVHYINLFTDERFVDDDFYDADHLCEIGAEKLSTILDKYIQ